MHCLLLFIVNQVELDENGGDFQAVIDELRVKASILKHSVVSIRETAIVRVRLRLPHWK